MEPDKTPLTTIIDGCRAGREPAQFALYRRFYAYVLTVSLHYCRDRREAEEVVQETFIKVFRQIDTFETDRSFKPWLRTITVRTAINYFRSSRKWRNFLDLEALPRHPAVENKALSTLREEDLFVLLQQLPPSYRLVFNLHVLEGYSHPEIAEMLGITVGSSKSNLAKARRKLRQMTSNFLMPFLINYIKP